uniref:Putative secreted protein n=1 Tax=Anopheles triannulatus TaxID=58253 RepID=A0A2M4B4Z3_9DIPT
MCVCVCVCVLLLQIKSLLTFSLRFFCSVRRPWAPFARHSIYSRSHTFFLKQLMKSFESKSFKSLSLPLSVRTTRDAGALIFGTRFSMPARCPGLGSHSPTRCSKKGCANAKLNT